MNIKNLILKIGMHDYITSTLLLNRMLAPVFVIFFNYPWSSASSFQLIIWIEGCIFIYFWRWRIIVKIREVFLRLLIFIRSKIKTFTSLSFSYFLFYANAMLIKRLSWDSEIFLLSPNFFILKFLLNGLNSP